MNSIGSSRPSTPPCSDPYGCARHRWFSDLDGDGDSDINDHNIQYAALTTTIHGSGYVPDADHDRDGDVDNTDYYTLLLDLGRAALDEGLISDPLGPDNPIGYDGYVFAPEAGLNAPAGSPQKQALGAYCVRFRWYLPETGRWLQRDPAEYVNGANSYEYCRSSPCNWSDAKGLCVSGSYRDLVNWAKRQNVAPVVTDLFAADAMFRAWRLSAEAIELAKALYPSSLSNAEEDAFRHCYWACTLTREIGPVSAGIILDCHEAKNTADGQSPCVTAMDEHNNLVGQGLSPVGSPVGGYKAHCQSACQAAMTAGDLMTKPPCDDPECPDNPRGGPIDDITPEE